MSRLFLDQVWTNANLTSTQKPVALSLADHADNNTGECWPSIKRIADRCSLSDRGVQKAIVALVTLGVISVAEKAGKNGVNVYRFSSPQSVNGTHERGERGSPPASVEGVNVVPDGVNVVPNGVNTVQPNYQEPPRTTTEHARGASVVGFEKFWEVFPKPRNEARSRKLFKAAVAEGVDPSVIVEAARAYAGESAGSDRQYVAGSESWLGKGRWSEQRGSAKAAPVKSKFDTPAEF
jgi:hypothetical protein